MTLFFPDLNVWLALSDAGHSDNPAAWRWLKLLPDNRKLAFSRYTQLGLLRLLTNSAVMGDQTHTLGEAWNVYDRWLEDPGVEFHPDPRGIEATFRRYTNSFRTQRATKMVGDCWLLAFAKDAGATLVTFDKALHELARSQGHSAVIPS